MLLLVMIRFLNSYQNELMYLIHTLQSNVLKFEFNPTIRFLASCLTLAAFLPETIMKQLQLYPNVCLLWRTDKNHRSKKRVFLNSAISPPKPQIFLCELKNGQPHKLH